MPACGIALNPPLSGSNYITTSRFGPSGTLPCYTFVTNEISGGYFDALGMRVLEGRNFIPKHRAKVVIINGSAARRWWPGQSPVGKTILANEKVRQIVGVVSDIYTHDLSTLEAVLYLPVSGHWGPPAVVVRDRAPASIDRVTAIMKEIEPRAQVRAEPLTANFHRKMQPTIVGAGLAGFLGLLALAIASVGVSGVFAYMVGQRTREIGVRMALGAQPPQIVRLVLGSSARALVCGLGCGMGVQRAYPHCWPTLSPGIDPLDPLAYSSVVLLLSAAVVLASAAPARRATRVDPVRALRWE